MALHCYRSDQRSRQARSLAVVSSAMQLGLLLLCPSTLHPRPRFAESPSLSRPLIFVARRVRVVQRSLPLEPLCSCSCKIRLYRCRLGTSWQSATAVDQAFSLPSPLPIPTICSLQGVVCATGAAVAEGAVESHPRGGDCGGGGRGGASAAIAPLQGHGQEGDAEVIVGAGYCCSAHRGCKPGQDSRLVEACRLGALCVHILFWEQKAKLAAWLRRDFSLWSTEHPVLLLLVGHTKGLYPAATVNRRRYPSPRSPLTPTE